MSRNNWSFSYAGVELPHPDNNGFAFTLEPIDDAERNANGDMIIQPITMKYTLTASWASLRGNEVQSILNTLSENRTGTLVFYNIVKGTMDEAEVYWGAGVPINFIRYDDDLNAQLWSSLNVNFIKM